MTVRFLTVRILITEESAEALIHSVIQQNKLTITINYQSKALGIAWCISCAIQIKEPFLSTSCWKGYFDYTVRDL